MINAKKISLLAMCGLLVLGLSTSPVQAQQATRTYTYTGAQVPIPYDGADLVVFGGIYVSRTWTISKVTVNVDVDYPRPGDLNLFLFSPQGTRTKLLEKNCESKGTLINITFDDAAASKYADFCPVEQGGSFRGNEPLSNFNGQNSFGTWILATENNGSDDFVGWFRGYSITITGTAITSTKPIFAAEGVRNAGSLLTGPVAPGAALVLAGANLGPATGVAAPSGSLPNTLSGVSVAFDGSPAAIRVASASGLLIVAPFSLQPGTKTAITVTNAGIVSDPVTLDVSGVAPAILTQNASGTGVAKAVNQDGSINSSTNPAAKGSHFAFYATGLGTVTPTLMTGQAPPSSPLSTTNSSTTAVVGGIGAPVTFSGAAPTYPGVYQVNAQIPATAATGSNVLQIYSSGVPSQSGVVIYVK